MDHLIGAAVKSNVNKVTTSNKMNSITVSDKISDIATDVYNNYLKDWILIVVVVAAISLMLISRYYDKCERSQDTNSSANIGNYTPEEIKIMTEYINNQSVNQSGAVKYDEQPSFDRLRSVNSQQDYVNYDTSQIPLNIPNQGLVYNGFNSQYSQQYENLNNPVYDANNVNTYPVRDYYSGTNNLYQNAVDTSIMNPLGFSNNFNTTTGSFINGMTSANKDNVVDYQQIMESMRSDLTNSLSVGPDYLNVGSGEPMMIPPYATNM